MDLDQLLDIPVSTPQEAIDAARNVIQVLIQRNQRLSPQLVRLGFHDCVGGCDGCVDLDNVNNNGLLHPIQQLGPVVNAYAQHGVSRADIWALAATTGADVAQGREQVNFDFDFYGRVNCEDAASAAGVECTNADGQVVPCDATHGPHRVLPSPDLNTHGVMEYFRLTFGFTMEQTVALMGAHTLGGLRHINSGFEGNGGRVRQQDVLNNAYYAGLVVGESVDSTEAELFDAPNWTQDEIENGDLDDVPNRFRWNRGGSGGGNGGRGDGPNGVDVGFRRLQDGGGGRGGGGGQQIMLNADIGLVHDFGVNGMKIQERYFVTFKRTRMILPKLLFVPRLVHLGRWQSTGSTTCCG
mmetsp:Transcript_3807/g.8577  ORF Transcript_3807/g.8577 Transcript_3807/m.8577 type:complete len:354 (+) Transcript_3807:2470-3531(+)